MRILALLALLIAVIPTTGSAQDGVPDLQFGMNGTTIINNLPADGRGNDFFQVATGYIVAVQSGVGPQLLKLTPKGNLDPTFGTNGIVDIPVSGGSDLQAVKQSGNKIVAACVTGNNIVVTRWDENGTQDLSFGSNGKTTITFSGLTVHGRDIETDSRDRIVICVRLDQNVPQYIALVRLSLDGVPDPQFGNQGKALITYGTDRLFPNDITIDQTDGIAIATASQDAGLLVKRFGIFMLRQDGSFNTDFNGTGIRIHTISTASEARAIVIQPDGKVVVAGTVENDPRGSFMLVRYLSDGSIDNLFGDQGFVFKSFYDQTDAPNAVKLTNDNNIIVAGYMRHTRQPGIPKADMVIMKLTPNGIPSPEFGQNGTVLFDHAADDENILSLNIQQDQKLLIGGYASISSKYRPVMMRLQNNTPFAVLLPFGTNWVVSAGTYVPLKWRYRNISHISITLTTDRGVTWIPIPGADNLSTDDTVFTWEVPNIPSGNCYLKVCETGDTTTLYYSPLFAITNPNVIFSINTEPVWIDADFDGYAIGQVDASATYLTGGSIVKHEWLFNDILIDTGAVAQLLMKTGTNYISLRVTTAPGGYVKTHSFRVDVIASKKHLQSSIRSGASYNNGTFFIGAANKTIYAFDSSALTSMIFQTTGAISEGICIAPNNRIYAGTDDGKLYCFDSYLNLVWEKDMEGVISSTPTVSSDGSRLYVSVKNGSIRAIDAVNGSSLWSWTTAGEITASTLLIEFPDDERHIIVGRMGTTAVPGSLMAIKDNGTSAQMIWVVQAVGPISATPAFLHNGISSMVYFTTENGYLHRVRWDGYRQETWSVSIGGTTKFCSPVIDWAGRVYVGSPDKNIYAFDSNFTSASQPARSFNVGFSAVGSPTLSDNGYLYLGTQVGYLFAFDLKQEPVKEMWKFAAGGSISTPVLVTENGKIHTSLPGGLMQILAEPDTFRNSAFTPKWGMFRGDNNRNCLVRMTLTDVDDLQLIPESFVLNQNYPNPFNPITVISFSLPEKNRTEIAVYDIIGNVIMRSVADYDVGHHQVSFDGSTLPSGVYFYRVTAAGKQETRKMILLK